MRAAQGPPGRRRVRTTLLVLLWVWALVTFTVVDLFFDVDEFDSIRPRSRWYSAARCAAHEMVGERYLENDEFAAQDDAPALRQEARAFTMPRIAPFLRVFEGVPPDHATSWDMQCRLTYFAQKERDPARRAAAERAIAQLIRMRETHDPQYLWRRTQR